MRTRAPAAGIEVFARFLRLGFTSFGGPVAHLGYFRREFVERAQWLDDVAFGEIVALCSVLPGPTSSQVGISLGALRAGPLGAVLAWLAFTTPSALAMTLFGLALRAAGGPGAAGLARAPAWSGALVGLGGAAAAVVLLAVLSLGKTLAATAPTRAIAAVAFVLALGVDRIAPAYQWIPLLVAGFTGLVLLGRGTPLPPAAPALTFSRGVGIASGALFAVLLIGLPLAAPPGGYLALFATFFRAGSLVFGGGHVVLPFLQSVIGPDLVPVRDFFAGYGVAQTVPGPLFTFAAFLGAVNRSTASGWQGAMVATLGIFAPSFLLVATAVPLWDALRTLPRATAALAGLNAGVVGLLAAVLIDPIGRSLVHAPLGIALAALAFLLFTRLHWPAWGVVAASAGLGAVVAGVVPLLR
jgi:chromate transporter